MTVAEMGKEAERLMSEVRGKLSTLGSDYPMNEYDYRKIMVKLRLAELYIMMASSKRIN